MSQQGVDPKAQIGDQKVPYHLFPSVAVIGGAMAMKTGAEKYGPYNWRGNHIRAETYVNAVKRHLDAWMDGEREDPESGLSPLYHAIASLAIMIDAHTNGKLVPPSLEDSGQVRHLLDMYTNYKPPQKVNHDTDQNKNSH